MDLDPIGRHCAFQPCSVLDLLPIRCDCLEWFCKLHISPDLHNCASLQRRSSESLSSAKVLPKCDFPGCSKSTLTTRRTSVDLTEEGESIQRGCPGCQLFFCANHRHMQSHECPSLSIEKDTVRHEAARAILAQKFSTPTSHTPVVARRHKGPPSDSKLAHSKVVHLMKLRHRAVSGDPKDRTSIIPVEQRHHVTVRLEITGHSAKEAILWFRKTTITGKALDLIIQYFGVPYPSTTLHLVRSSTETGDHVLHDPLKLSEQLEDGSTVVVTDSQPIQ